MKKLLLSLFASSLLSIAHAQTAVNFKKHISFLASDSLHGRMTGSVDEHNAAEYIISEFQKMGVPNLKGNFNSRKYLQQFEYHPKTDSVKTTVKGNNVVAFIDNHAKQTIIIGAHYDHLGWGLDAHAHSAYRGEPAIHNGADDNASGVATIMELARILVSDASSSRVLAKHNYLFIAFSGEELGLYGSKWFAEHTKFDSLKTDYMLNFDMVGRLDSNKLMIYGNGTSPLWNEAMKKIESPLRIKTSESGVGPSDHTSFYLKSIPVLHFFSGQHKDYHKPSDDESKINYTGMEEIMAYVIKLIKELDTIEKIPFTKTKDDTNESTPKFTVTLGVMPDYTFEGEGMRIDGVTEGKPAEKAELKAGDVVIQLGDTKVTDMRSYMKALSQFKKGDITKVRVKRGNDTVEKDINF